MKNLLHNIVSNLVDMPSSVKITQTDCLSHILYEIQTEKADAGKVIGKKGRTINSIRDLLESIAARNKKRILVEIVE